MQTLQPADLDFAALVHPQDTVWWGQVCAEPTLLTETLMAQRHAIGPFTVVMGLRMADTVWPEHADIVRMRALNAGGTNRALARAGVLDMLPLHVSQMEGALERGDMACDVALVQVSPPDAQGRYSLGLANDYVRAAVSRARMVIAEINDQLPWIPCDAPLTDGDIDIAVHTSRPLPQVRAAQPGELDRCIASWAAPFISDGATLQMGVGTVPEALMAQLRDRRGLGVHSGLLTDSLVDLVECGAVTNENKPIDRGVSVSGVLMGTDRLYRFCAHSRAIRLAPLSYTHQPATLARLPRLISINSALEIDLTGQVNAEALGNDAWGGVGGQVDFVRGAALSPGGRSLIALPSLTTGGGASRIVARLQGPVTTARSDVDLIVTEHGVAQLRGKSIRQRIEAMLAIAHPAHREPLAREAHPFLKAL